MPLLFGCALLLAACGGETPRPVSVSSIAAPAPVAPTPAVNYDTAEYRRSNTAVAANALPAWQAGVSGEGVTIGFVDTGIDAGSAEFAGRILPTSRDVTGQGRSITDVDGHGTAIATIAAAARNDSGTVGIAPAASLAVMRADSGDCSDGCRFSDAAIATGIDAAVAAGARVINISLGGSSGSAQLREAFRRATSSGVVLVMSAGNDGLDSVGALPAAALGAGGSGAVIVVGAADANGVITDFSNRAGSAASNYMVALGNRVLTTDHQGTQWLMSGTSFAAPSVAAAVALLAQYHPGLSASQIVDILLSSATDAGNAGTDSVYGRGVLNIGRALAPIGATSLAGTAVSVPLDTGGTLGAALGNGLSSGEGLRAVPIEDGYGRAYSLNLARDLRSATAGRLAARLQAAALAEAQTTHHAGPFTFSLHLSAAAGAAPATPDAFRQQPRDTEALGFALRGVDARAGQRNPLRETRLSLSAGGLGLVAATGRDTALALPGAAASGFVTMDGLSPDDRAPSGGEQMFAAEAHRGGLTLALAASNALPADSGEPGPHRAMRQSRLTLAARYDLGEFHLASRLSRTNDSGGMLGSRLDPAYGLLGGASTLAGIAVGWQDERLALRLAASSGRHRPEFAAGGLLRDGGDWHSQSWSATAERRTGGGTLRLGIARPLVVTRANLALANGVTLSAAATARETATELGFTAPGFTLAAFHRANAGNLPGVSDSGGAFTLRTAF